MLVAQSFEVPSTSLPVALGKAGLYAYGILLALTLYGDWRRARAQRVGGVQDADLRPELLLYIPFMAAVPKVSFHYTLVTLLALLPALSWRWTLAGPRERVLLVWISVGVGLSLFHAVALAGLSGSLYAHAVPGLGLLLVLLGVTALKLRLGLRGEVQAAPRD